MATLFGPDPKESIGRAAESHTGAVLAQHGQLRLRRSKRTIQPDFRGTHMHYERGHPWPYALPRRLGLRPAGHAGPIAKNIANGSTTGFKRLAILGADSRQPGVEGTSSGLVVAWTDHQQGRPAVGDPLNMLLKARVPVARGAGEHDHARDNSRLQKTASSHSRRPRIDGSRDRPIRVDLASR